MTEQTQHKTSATGSSQEWATIILHSLSCQQELQEPTGHIVWRQQSVPRGVKRQNQTCRGSTGATVARWMWHSNSQHLPLNDTTQSGRSIDSECRMVLQAFQALGSTQAQVPVRDLLGVLGSTPVCQQCHCVGGNSTPVVPIGCTHAGSLRLHTCHTEQAATGPTSTELMPVCQQMATCAAQLQAVVSPLSHVQREAHHAVLPPKLIAL